LIQLINIQFNASCNINSLRKIALPTVRETEPGTVKKKLTSKDVESDLEPELILKINNKEPFIL